MKIALRRVASVLTSCFLFATLLFTAQGTSEAQTFYGSVVGTVTDNSGAIAAGASVSITNLGTNETRTAKTDNAGDYRFENLVPANYKVVVQFPSFKTFRQQPVQVTVDTSVRVNAVLQVGEATETVEVTSATPMIQTETGTLGTTVELKQIAAVPLNGRNPLNLLELVPGVVPQGNTSGGAALNSGIGSSAGPATSSAAWGNYQIGGGFPLQSGMYIDGSSINYMNKNFTGLVPVQDIIQEFKVETSAVSAEFDRFGGGVVNLTTKSGSNAFHGSVYEYFRNNVLNANYFFTKRSGGARPQYNQNQFGGTVGGPIWKNKAFFFYGWEGIHIRTGVPLLTNIPSPALRNGVINEVYNSKGVLQNSKIFDPRGQCNVTHQAGTAAAPGTWTITNLSTCIDPTAKVLETFYPNNTNNPGNAADNYYNTVSTGTDGHQQTLRVDWQITPKNRAFVRATLWPLSDKAPSYLNNANGWLTANVQHHALTNQFVIGDTHAFNPTTLLDVRVDYLRGYADAVAQPENKVDLSQFGPAYSALQPYLSFTDYPAWTFSGGTQLHNLFNFNYAALVQTFYNNYHITGELTKILGKHTFKAGAQGLLQQRADTGSDSAPTGLYTFSADLGGDEWANFLFGAFDKGTLTTVKKTTTYNYYSGYYIADTWQAFPRLTLTYGLRYNLLEGPAENGNNASVLLPTTVDPNTGIYGTVGLVASSLYGRRSTLVPTYTGWAPRFGFAYRVTDNTVVRGGYGLSYLPNDSQTGEWGTNSPVNSATTTNTNTGTTVNYTLSNPFPATAQYPHGIAPALGRANTTFMTNYIGQSVSAPYPYEPYPYAQQMNLSIGHQFKGDTAINVGYAHSLEVHLASLSAGLDQLPDQYDALGSALMAAPATPISYDGIKLPAAYQTYGQTLRPYPAYTNYLNSAAYHGTSTYDALQISAQKRFRSAGQIGVAYTWSKIISDTDTIVTSQETLSGGAGGNGEGLYQDYYNPQAERSLYSYDVPNRLVINYLLSLPFGKGQRFASGVHGVAGLFVSGWSADGITTLQSGYPLYMNISGNNLSKYFGAGTIRPNYIAGCNRSVGGSGYSKTLAGATWFNTGCFTVPGAYSFGNESRTDDAVKSSGIDNWDFSVEKSTALHDQIALKFRVEFFNIFNRVQFAPPVTQADSTQYGQILQQANSPRLIQGALRLDF